MGNRTASTSPLMQIESVEVVRSHDIEVVPTPVMSEMSVLACVADGSGAV
jgi:hypothetical protein